MNESYDDSIQYRATHRQYGIATAYKGAVRKSSKGRTLSLRVEKFISRLLPSDTYLVVVSRKGFCVQKSGFATLSEARQWRDEQLALAPPLKLGKGITKYDFSGVDWSKSNQEIAALLGCTVPCVYSRRIKLGK